MNQILILKNLKGNCWQVYYRSGPERGKVESVFGTPRIDTAYLLSTPREVVFKQIKKSHPDAQVKVIG
ncbi:MAG: hypothetical protein JXB26_01150 [Candidatus Aminicenantes bacterium]|nr:hypothetical protein [Candidatus Aminicenantes bacterium]